MAVNDNPTSGRGWPFVNHGMEVRGTQTPRGPSRQTIVYPRTKFTFVVEMVINPRALDPNRMETNLANFLNNGRLYATIRAVDHPKPNMAFEKLRSYNKNVLLPTKMEYPPATITFHDDNSSIAAALWKEYRAFYQYEGRIGKTGSSETNLINEYRQSNDMVGDNVRSKMGVHPSMGMRLRESDSRHFFDSIIVYDLGADPDSVNVYSYLYPMITGLEHDPLDYEDGSGLVGMSMSFEYEGYYQLVGLNNRPFHEDIERYLGTRPITTSSSVKGHAIQTGSDQTGQVGSTVLSTIDNLTSNRRLSSNDSTLVFPSIIPSGATITQTSLDDAFADTIKRTLDRLI